MKNLSSERGVWGTALHEIYGDIQGFMQIFQLFIIMVLIGLISGIFILLSNNNVLSAIILAFGVMPVLVSLYLVRLKKFESAAISLAIYLILLNTVLATMGLGIHSISNFAYPAILIIASLVTRKRIMFFLTFFTALCIAWLVFGELLDLYTPTILVRSVPGDFFSASLIVILTAIMVHRLTGSLFQSFSRLQKEIAERKTMEENLRQREAILEAVTFAAEQFIKTPDWRANIDLVLERLGRTINATHAYLFEHHPGQGSNLTSSMRFEWTAPGYPSDLENPEFQSISFEEEGFESYFNKLGNGEPFIGNLSSFLPAEKEFFSQAGIRSMVEVPLMVDGKWWGTIGFDDLEREREWSNGEVDALKIAAGILAGAIQREIADSAVQESERIYRRAIEAADAIPYYRDYKNNRYTFMGEGIIEITGYSADEMTPEIWKRLEFVGFPRGSMAHLTYEEADRLTEEGIFRHWECDYRIVNRYGQTRWVADSCIQIRDEEDVRIGVIGILQDITDRKLIEASLRQREAILETVTFAAEQFLKTSDWRMNINNVLERLGKTIDASHAYLFEHHIGEEGVEVSSLTYEWTAPDFLSNLDDPDYKNTHPVQLGIDSTDEILRTGDVYIGNLSTFPLVEKDRLGKLGIKAIVEVPLFVNGAWWGTIGFDDMVIERNWSLAEVDALKIAAGILSAAIQRQEAESAVQESERIYRQAIEAAGAVPYYRDYRKDRYAFMGSEIEKIIGYKPGEVTIELWHAIMKENIPLGEGDGLPIDDAVLRARSGVFKVWKSDMRVIARNGETRWLTDSAVELFDDAELSYASIGILQDITDRKLIEANLRKRESILEAVAFAAEQFLKTSDWRININAVLERLGKEFNASHAYLFEKHLGGSGVMLNSLRYEWVVPGQTSDMDNPAYQNAPVNEVDFKRYYDILNSGEPFIGSTSYFRESKNDKVWMDSTGIKALLEMRIVVDGKQWGTLGFDDMVSEREWAPMEVDVLRVAANVLGAAIKRQLDEAVLQKELDERKRAELALRFSEEKFSKAFHTTQVLMTIEDEKHRFVDANRAFMDAFGFDRKDVIGHSASELNVFYDPADAPRLRQAYRDDGSLKDFEMRFRRKSGDMGFILLSSESIYLDNIEYSLTSGLDITDRKQAEVERERLIADLQSKNDELESFTYTVSHDLKSPLVTINGFLGYLEQDAASGNTERLKKDTLRIQEAVNKMQRLLNELLELSRIGRMMNSPVRIPFNDLVREAMEIVHGRLEERSVTVQIQPSLPAIYGDRPRLTEVLQNLLDNAAKYMGEQKDPRIEIGQRGVEDGKPVFFIRDNGMGIAPEHHERVFGLFNKLDAKSEGTGVGLALVKRIIEFHGGRIWVESEAGKGSTFLLTLPSKPKPDSVI